MNNQFLAEEISKREYQITNRDKMIKHLQEEHKKRGEQIIILKDKIRRYKIQIKDTENKIKEYRI